MSDGAFPRSGRSRLGEVALWTVAGLLTLSAHAGAAYYLLQEQPEPVADGGPPAAIMIELAALPEAVETEETVEANDVEDTQEVKSEVPEKVEEVPPEEVPQPLPEPEPVAEQTPPEPEPIPEPLPEPPPEVAEPLPEEIPDPVEEIDPVQEQQMAALENVEVPLPVMRPPPPPVDKKVEKKEEREKKKVERKQTATPPPSTARETAKVETTQSDRTAASRNSSGFFSSSMTPAKWQSRVVAQIRRKKPRDIPASGVTISVAFKVSETGSLSGIRLLGSTGNASLDQQIIAWVERSSPVPEPPPEVNRNVTLPITIK